jgi:hypothetical protein
LSTHVENPLTAGLSKTQTNNHATANTQMNNHSKDVREKRAYSKQFVCRAWAVAWWCKSTTGLAVGTVRKGKDICREVKFEEKRRQNFGLTI